MSYKIIGDSCCDYTEEGDGLYWLDRVALTIELDGNCYVDDTTLDCMNLIKKMAKSKNAPKSACPSVGAYMAAYNCGADDIYVVTLSAKLSGSYNSAVAAKDLFNETFPEKNVHVFDSRSAAAGQIAICLKIHEFSESGMKFEDVVLQTNNYIDEMSTFFLLETLDTLRKGGRLSHIQALVTGALKIKLVMGGDDGNICIRAKALTSLSAISKMISQISEKCEKLDLQRRVLVITECNCRELAEKIRDEILKICNFKKAVICRAGGISTIYANSGGFIVAF